MNKIEMQVDDLMGEIDDKYSTIDTLHERLMKLAGKQENKILETVSLLTPVMKKIREKGYLFRGNDIEYESRRGPILKHDKINNLLYIYDVYKNQPISLNLYNEKEELITYRDLLREVEFPVIMDALLTVLNHHERLEKSYHENISGLEDELKKYEAF